MNVFHVERYGKKVHENSDMEKQRQSECLCMNCERMKPGKSDHCHIASKFYEVCKEHGNAFILTRCEDYKAKITIHNIIPGAYEVFWKNEPYSSIATIGYYEDGTKWIAACERLVGSVPLKEVAKQIERFRAINME